MKHSYSTFREQIPRRWMVIYTRSKWEKKVDQLLRQQGINSFCPLIKSRRKWADRTKEVEMPLFNSYVFVHINAYERALVQQTAGVLSFVEFCGSPAIVPDADIERIHSILQAYTELEVVNLRQLNIGDKVTIREGLLLDREGEVVEFQGKSVLVMLKQLDCALIAKVRVPVDQLLLSQAVNRRSALVSC